MKRVGWPGFTGAACRKLMRLAACARAVRRRAAWFRRGFLVVVASAELACGVRAVPRSPEGDGAAQLSELLPTRLRRLSNAEWQNSVEALVGHGFSAALELPPDVRHAGFTSNAAQPYQAAELGSLHTLSQRVAQAIVESGRVRQCAT